MKELHFKITKEERSYTYKQTIDDGLFNILRFPINYMPTKIISPKMEREIISFEEKLMDLNYDIVYDILNTVLGIPSSDIEYLEIDDYYKDKIIINVELV